MLTYLILIQVIFILIPILLTLKLYIKSIY